jgi:hypothetical protein
MRCLAIVFALSALAAQSPAPRTGTLCSVAGRVVNEATGGPLRESTVALRPEGASSLPFITETDTQGRYEMVGIEPARYTATAVRAGYIESAYGARRPGSPGITLVLDPGRPSTGVDFKLKAHGVIAGRVFDIGGEPCEGAIVVLMRPAYVNGRQSLKRIDSASTNDSGDYRIWGVPPGRYYIAANLNFSGMLGFTSLSGSGAVNVGEPVYRPTFHPSTLDEAAAEPIEVSSGAATSADVRLAPARSTRIRGRVIDHTARTGGSIIVEAVAATPAQVARAVRTTAKPDGEFELEGAPSGKCWLAARTSGGGVVTSAHRLVELNGESMENVVLTLGAAAQVSGRVRTEEGTRTPPNLRALQVALLAVEPPASNLPVNSKAPEAAVADSGAFTMSGVNPEAYLVNVNGLSGPWYVKSIRMGETDALEKALDLSGGAPATLEVVLSDRGGAIQGSAGALGVTVALVPQDAKHRQQASWYRATPTDRDGNFSLTGLPPGAYKLFAWEDVEDGAWMDPEFLKLLESKGKPVTVEPGGSEKVELNPIP